MSYSEFSLFPKAHLDWRDPEHREELFNRYFRWRVLAHDLDHGHYMKVMTEGYPRERKMWFALCFGMTYRTPQCYAYTESLPSINDVTDEWHQANWKRTTYGTDARYNKGHFFTQVESIREWLNGQTFEKKIDGILVGDTEEENFWNLYNEIIKLHKFGRMTGWLTLQALYDLLGLPIDPNQIMLEGFSPNNDSSLKSIWNGFCAYENKREKMVGQYGGYEVTDKDIERCRVKILEYTERAEEYMGMKIDSFRKESIWCQYKRLFNEPTSKEYPGHASGDAVSRYLYYKENWPEIDWEKFRRALRSQPGMVKGMTYNSEFNKVFGDTGLLLNMHELYDDMPNAYTELGINPEEYRVREIWTDSGLEVPETFNMKEELR